MRGYPCSSALPSLPVPRSAPLPAAPPSLNTAGGWGPTGVSPEELSVCGCTERSAGMEPDRCAAAAAGRKNFYGNERSEAASPVCVNGVCELYVGTASSCAERQHAGNPEFWCAAAPSSAPCRGSELGVPQTDTWNATALVSLVNTKGCLRCGRHFASQCFAISACPPVSGTVGMERAVSSPCL